MPGMMNTILNLGINDEIAAGLAERTGNPRFAYDSYRRFIQMFADVVLDADARRDGRRYRRLQGRTRGYSTDVEMQAEDWQEVIGCFKNGRVPGRPLRAAQAAVEAVFKSWHTRGRTCIAR
jgi:pyruvate,orthophosphate dikinase